MSERPTVFVVDDDMAARESLSAVVRSMDIDCECFGSAESFLDADVPDCPGCVVTDLRLTGMSGLDLQEKLAETHPILPVVMISAFATIPVAVKAMKNGGLTFLEKTCTEHELWQAINDALRVNEIIREKSQKQRAVRESMATLTNGEADVLRSIVAGQGNKQVALTLGIGLRTVEERRRRVMKKLEADSFAHLMRIAIEAERAAQHE